MIKFLLLLLSFSLPIYASEDPLNKIEYKSDSFYSFYVEIPAGTKQKWQVNKKSGFLEWEEKDGKKRVVNFLSYPGNYGFIPQTLSGDNDAIDVVDIDESVSRGTVKKVKIIGGLYFEDKKEKDYKLIGVDPNGTFSTYKTIDEILIDKPAVLEILRNWFSSYKKPGKMVFFRYISKSEAIKIIENSHKKWKESQ